MWKKLSQMLSHSSGGDVRRPRRFRPGVEGLEGRLVPAALAVTTFADVVNPADGLLSLREAISRANATAAHDTIVLKPGVYRIGLTGAGENANVSGDFDVTNTVTILGQGAAATVIDGGRRDRLFEIIGTYGVGLARLTLRNGAAVSREAESNDGGAIQALTASLRMDGCLVTGNRGTKGGGINAEDGNVTLVGTTVSGNVAKGFGGGIHLGRGTLTLRDSVVRRNLAGGNGAGAHAVSVILTNSTVSDNSAVDDGGGIFATTLTLTNSTVRGNSAGNEGGGIVATMANSTNSTVSGNFATVGGGIFADTAILTNSTVSGNRAGKVGGGIFASAGALTNCTVTENSAGDRGGVFHVKSETGGVFSVKNTIIAQNLVSYGGLEPDVSGEFVSLGHNLIGTERPIAKATASTGFGGNGDQVGTPESPIEARLAPLANNGGRTLTHALLAGSRAIDRGDNAGVPATDQRGVARRRDGDGNRVAVVDIGAFER